MITKEKIKHHIAHLEEKHRDIDREIAELHDRRGNDIKIETLKKVKLHLKDEIEKFKKTAEGLE